MDNIKNINERLDIANQFQDECHAMIDMILDENKSVSYNDAMHTYIFQKLAEFELRLRKLESNKNHA
jgi:hypothetical protein